MAAFLEGQTWLQDHDRTILEALLAGQTDPEALAELARGRLRRNISALRQARPVTSAFKHHGLLVAQMLAHIDFLDAAIAELGAHLTTASAPFAATLRRVWHRPKASPRTQPSCWPNAA